MKTMFRAAISTVLLLTVFNLSAHASSSSDKSTDSVIVKSLTGKIVKLENGRVKRSKEGLNKDADYYALYFSAHWCPPCRNFTPKLSEFYKKYSEENKNFEVVFVSSDRSEDAMEEYIVWGDMTFPALEFKKKKRARKITKYSDKGIPRLVIVDRDGNILSDSYVNGSYVGPTKVLRDLKELIEKKG